MSIARKILMGAAGAGGDKTYVDDVFSPYVYRGNGANRTITNGIDLAGEGGLVWVKGRDVGYFNNLQDNVSGLTGIDKYLTSNDNYIANWAANGENDPRYCVTAFNNNGFDLGIGGQVNINNYKFASWTFRRQKGFFDIVSYTGNGSNRTIAHNLGSVPGCIMVKCTSEARDWTIFHRGVAPVDPASYRLRLNTTDARQGNAGYFNSTEPTSTHFSLGSNSDTNANGQSYVAYIFAGGASTAATNRCVDFDGNDALTSATSSDLSLGTGDYTIEFWFNADAIGDTPLFENRVSGSSGDTTGFTLTAHGSSNGVRIWWSGSSRINGGGSSLSVGKWHHLAATRSSGTTYLFLDGRLLGTTTDAINLTSTEAHIAGGKYNGGTSISHYFNGRISNFRLIKGTALYTSSFRPPYEPLTNVTNTKLLCCQSSAATTATVAPGTITAVGNPTVPVDASGTFSDSPFDDPEGFQFGEEGDQNLIKCGSYKGTGSSGLEINVGWEPSFLLWKESSGSGENWFIHDNIRGWDNKYLKPNSSGAESDSAVIKITSTGFIVESTDGARNHNNETYVYMLIRRPDGYVGKPAEAGTDVFAMDTGAASSIIPNFDSGFPVDFALDKKPASSGNWDAAARVISDRYLQANNTAAEVSYNKYTFDSNVGWNEDNGLGSIWQSWMWKRHAGFDVVSYKGNNTAGSSWSHNLGKIPEMIWIKNRGATADWAVGHKGLNGGTNPWNYRIFLNTTAADSAANDYWGGSSNTGKPPTSTHFFLGSSWTESNANNNNYIAMLFASVGGISKCGFYNGSANAQTITTGFQPRLIIIKRTTAARDWLLFDTLRGIGPGANDDKVLFLNSTSDQESQSFLDVTSTGFTLNANLQDTNHQDHKYIYYAHA